MSGPGRISAWLGAAGIAALVAGCAGKPAPAPAPIVRQAPPPAPAPVPPASEPGLPAESEASLTPGDWSYSGEAGGSAATFGPAGTPLLTLRCDSARRQVSLSVPNAAQPLRIETSFGQRILNAGAALAAGDPLLDEIVFSRGRFTVEGPGAAALVIPAWPEPARVVEDCRG
jgi:hypothetical protein